MEKEPRNRLSAGANGTKELARLNDLLRRNGVGGRVVVTTNIQQLSAEKRGQLLDRVAGQVHFDPENDPYGERDFGAVEFEGERYFWKIDYYDQYYDGLSPDPLDQTVTRRVMTVMRADEY